MLNEADMLRECMIVDWLDVLLQITAIISVVTPYWSSPSPRCYRNGHPNTAVLPRISLSLPRIFRGYRGITVVPITVQLSTLDVLIFPSFWWAGFFIQLLTSHRQKNMLVSCDAGAQSGELAGATTPDPQLQEIFIWYSIAQFMQALVNQTVDQGISAVVLMGTDRVWLLQFLSQQLKKLQSWRSDLP